MLNLKKSIFLMVCLMAAVVANAASWDGETSVPRDTVIGETTYYLISNAAELAWFSAEVNSGKSNINAKLMNDISFYDGTVSSSAHCEKNFPTIGASEANAFKGIFDGNGFSIGGLFYEGTKPFGVIFQFISEGAQVKNFSIVNSYIYANLRNESSSGVLFYSNEGLIENVTIKNDVLVKALSERCAGCLGTHFDALGYENQVTGILRFVKNESDITADVVTGMVTTNYGLIEKSENSGTIIGGNYANGFVVGNDSTGVLKFCINSGRVSSSWNTAAVVNVNAGIMERNINIGIINVDRTVSYDKAVFVYENKEGAILSNNINLGNTTGGSDRRGIVFDNKGTVKNNFYLTTSTQKIAGPESLINTQTNVDGTNYTEMAWSLNTTNGTELNTGIWTQNDTINNGYPYFADGENKGIYKVTRDIEGDVFSGYYKGSYVVKSEPIAADGYLFVGFLDQDGNVFLGADSLNRDLYLKAYFVEEDKPEFLVIFKDANANTMTALITNKADSTLAAFPEAPAAVTGMRFKGWLSASGSYMTPSDKFVMNETLTATYEPLVYEISFNRGGETIKKVNVPFKEKPDFGGIPVKEKTAAYTYAFKQWVPEIVEATQDASYEAVFDSVLNVYKVKLVVLEDTLLVTSHDYGTSITLPDAVDRDGYKFEGWFDAEGNKLGDAGDKITIVDDITITAKYEINKYTITFMFGSTKLQSSQVEYNSIPVYEGKEPSREKTVDYTYEFAGWTPEIKSVTGAQTYTAVFDSTKIEKPASSSSVPNSSSSSGKGESSSSNKGDSSSSGDKGNSSSSDKTALDIVWTAPQFNVEVVGRTLLVAGVENGAVYNLMDMQGRLLKQGSAATNFTVEVPHAGSYLLRIGKSISRVSVK